MTELPINQKEYLKKYLAIGKAPGEKKKKKKKKPSTLNRVQIIDDDIEANITNNVIETDPIIIDEDAPQIVAIIDERPPSLRVDEKTKNPLWQPIGTVNDAEQIEQKHTIKGFKIAPKTNDRPFLAPDKSPPRKKKKAHNDDASPPRKSRDNERSPPKVSDDNLSPPRKSSKDNGTSSFNDIVIKEERKSVSRDVDVSPPRRRRGSPPRQENSNSLPEGVVIKEERRSVPRDENNSPPRRSRAVEEDISPPRRNRAVEEDISPPRRNRAVEEDISPPRRNRAVEGDMSPPRRNRAVEGDMSPPRRNRPMEKDVSPPRRNRGTSGRSHSRWGDNSPPRKNTREDRSPPRRGRETIDWGRSSSKYDHSPSKRKEDKSKSRYDHSPPRKGKNYGDSPKRRMERNRTPDFSPPRKSRKEENSEDKRSKRMEKTLDGKTAGLQNARDLVEETRNIRSNEENLFKSLSKEVSGENAETAHRSTGRIRKLQEQEERKKQRLEEEEKNKEKYERWGRGLAQIESREQQLQEQLHEMSKPLARYADDEDLEKYLKEQEREGDPMLAYLRKKKRKKAAEAGVVEKPQFEGEFMPNRYGIRPGHRWDGVDRSNGYEKKWFEIQNQKKAQEEISYKWSTEDM